MFAVNYSPQCLALIQRGVLDVDLFKCPEWPDLIADVSRQHPCYVHFPFRIGRRLWPNVDWAEVEDLFESTEARYVNAHLAPCIADYPGMTLTSQEPAARAKVIGDMSRDACELAERRGSDGVVLENVMWDPDPPWQIPEVCLEAAVIREIVEEADSGLVLDLAHAAISARYFGLDERDYVSQLPVDRLRELHVSGTHLGEDKLWHDHYPLEAHDWRLVGWAMERVRRGDWPEPWLVTLEYGGVGPEYESRTDERVLAEQAPRLSEMVHSVRC